MTPELVACFTDVHCRTGSLEIAKYGEPEKEAVHCRTGSLEKLGKLFTVNDGVHCRTGSLEKSAGA